MATQNATQAASLTQDVEAPCSVIAQEVSSPSANGSPLSRRGLSSR
jgi:hypothetical protein